MDRRRLVQICLFGMFLLSMWVTQGKGGEVEEMRVKIALEIFPRIVAVDNDIDKKLTPEGKIRLLLLYEKNRLSAENMADTLRQNIHNIKGKSVEVVVAGISQPLTDKTVSAIFLTEILTKDLFKYIVEFSIQRHLILFSAFDGDVERGATAGIAISSKIKPFFNLTTLRQSGIKIHQVLLNISKLNE